MVYEALPRAALSLAVRVGARLAVLCGGVGWIRDKTACPLVCADAR